MGAWSKKGAWPKKQYIARADPGGRGLRKGAWPMRTGGGLRSNITHGAILGAWSKDGGVAYGNGAWPKRSGRGLRSRILLGPILGAWSKVEGVD